jgi:hypothetical protein
MRWSVLKDGEDLAWRRDLTGRAHFSQIYVAVTLSTPVMEPVFVSIAVIV